MAPPTGSHPLTDAGEHACPEERELRRGVRAAAWLHREFECVCQETGLSLSQYRLMMFLRHGPERAGELAAQIAIKRPTLTALVSGLERNGCIERHADESDGRGVRIELTEKGLETFELLERALTNSLRGLTEGDEGAGVRSGLDALADIIKSEIDERLSRA